MKKGRISPELTKDLNSKNVLSNIFAANTAFLNEDTELALELTNETAYPKMSNYQNK